MNTLADALNSVKVAEKNGRPIAKIRRPSKLAKEILAIFKDSTYIADFQEMQSFDTNKLELEVKLNGTINDCGAISPNYPVNKDNWEKYEERYLPGKGVGLLVVTTSKGVMTHLKAKEAGIGGSLLAFVY